MESPSKPLFKGQKRVSGSLLSPVNKQLRRSRATFKVPVHPIKKMCPSCHEFSYSRIGSKSLLEI